MLRDRMQINEQGHLCFAGADTISLAKTYGTPLYVMDEDLIRHNCRMYKEAMDKEYAGHGLPLYACKAFCCKEICRVVDAEGMGLDVVSGGELYTALAAGFPADKMVFHGNNKTKDELCLALQKGVGRIVVDNLTELQLLSELAEDKGVVARILLRIKPGIDAHTHKYIRTGQIDSKFGFALETGEAMEAVRQALAKAHVELCGLHCHIGSQVLEVTPFVLAVQVMLDFLCDIRGKTGCTLKELNLGGGFGIQYTKSDDPVPYGDYIQAVSAQLRTLCQAKDFPLPFIYMEPGRSIVGEAGLTLYTIGAVKKIPDVRTYVSVDGGMTDNPRYILYQSDYTCVVANRVAQPADLVATIAGRCCESGDLIQENTSIQRCAPGDILAVFGTGAYNYSMASNYNRVPRPPVVFVRQGQARLVVRRESYADLLINDL